MESKKISVNKKMGAKQARLSLGNMDPKKVKFEQLEDAVFDIIKVLEAQRLTGVELSFKDGWKFKLIHTKRQKMLLAGGAGYPERKA